MTTTATNQDLGIRGEIAAALFLERANMVIIEKNWTTKRGEIDLIALDDDELVFIEVKTRWDTQKRDPEDAVDVHKRKQYGKLAAEYIATHEVFAEHPIRFDVIGITVKDEEHAILRHHRCAFVCE